MDIRFSKTMNSCKVLQIRYASVGRLLERLTDLRFLSIDFLNTFLHSYRVFTTAVVVLDKLIAIYRKPISAIPARWAGGVGAPPPSRMKKEALEGETQNLTPAPLARVLLHRAEGPLPAPRVGVQHVQGRPP